MSIHPHSVVDVIGLLVCSVYCTIPLFWLVVHPFVERWRRHGRRAYALILPIWAIFIVSAFLTALPFRRSHLYENWWATLPALLIFLVGLSVYRAAFREFERTQVSGLAELEPERHRQQLVTSGIRSRVRHPIYLGHLCEILAWCIWTGLLPLYVMAALAIMTGAVMIRVEERELEARFGEAYRSYKREVPAVLPRWRSL